MWEKSQLAFSSDNNHTMHDGKKLYAEQIKMDDIKILIKKEEILNKRG